MNIFKIVLPGSKVDNSRVAEDIVNSAYPNPKVDTTASPPHAGIIFLNWASTGITMASGTSRLLYSFPHNYNYAPGVFGVCAFDAGSGVKHGPTPFFIGAIGVIVLESDRNNVNLKYFSSDIGGPLTAISPFTMRVRYYVFAERGYQA